MEQERLSFLIPFILSNALGAWVYYVLSAFSSTLVYRSILIISAIACLIIALLISSNAVSSEETFFRQFTDILLFGRGSVVFWLTLIYVLNVPAAWLAVRKKNLRFQGIFMFVLLLTPLVYVLGALLFLWFIRSI
jgi:hypothetical protein